MNAQVLIDSIVRQVTVLIAQLATSGGIRAPLSHVANQVFLDLSRELEEQGVSRKVSADMFGMALRAYIRKVRRLSEAETAKGRTLWQALLDFVRAEGLVTRARVLERFAADGELQVTAMLHDLTESGLVFGTGTGKNTVYRLASDDELDRVAQLSDGSGGDELAWALIYREGPLSEQRLQERLRRSAEATSELVARLLVDGRIQRNADASLDARDFVVALGAANGWEAAVFDHVQAVVQTICQRLQQAADGGQAPVGGSTYSFDVWAGHPLEHAAKQQLTEVRERLGALRQQVDDYNRAHGLPREYEQVVTYVGQCLLERSFGVISVFAFVDGACQPTIYGGCGGNDNRFSSVEECQSVCELRPSVNPCSAGRVDREICVACGPAGGCAEMLRVCAQPCETESGKVPGPPCDANQGFTCSDGVCQMGHCI